LVPRVYPWGSTNHSETRKVRKMVSEELFFRRGDLCRIISLTPRQVQYWEKTGLLGPTYRTKGGHGRYSFQDLIAYKTAKRLLDAGVPLQRIRKSVANSHLSPPEISSSYSIRIRPSRPFQDSSGSSTWPSWRTRPCDGWSKPRRSVDTEGSACPNSRGGTS